MLTTVLVATLVGAFVWTLAEYVIHRFLGHDRRTMPNFFSKEHTAHHSQGDYFAPTAKKVQATLVALAFVLPAASLAVGFVAGLAFSVGFLSMYVTYEVLHRREHTHEGIGRYGRYLRRHHFHHHFENPRMNHGVTSPVWDIVFGTYESTSTINVPEKLCMRWLRDPSTGEVRGAFAGWYRIVPLKQRSQH
jgi:sterol desaturase/sphingolipid hydroxylase (fatty acid hydroxylase superfamily)